jgi:hypothetical protein
MADVTLRDHASDATDRLEEAHALIEELEGAVSAQRVLLEERDAVLAKQADEITRLERAALAHGSGT